MEPTTGKCGWIWIRNCNSQSLQYRPDAVIWSPNAKHLVMIELTVPWEERCQTTHERKRGKYSELQKICREQGWHTWIFPVEVGCRDFPAQSVWTMFSALGIVGRDKKNAVQRLSREAERASIWLWSKREQESWRPSTEG